MFLRELRPVTAGEITLYEGTGDEHEPFRNIFIGDCLEIPEELLNREVALVSGWHCTALDIKLKREEPPC